MQEKIPDANTECIYYIIYWSENANIKYIYSTGLNINQKSYYS